ncbi:MAG: hypothetical protein KDA27_24325 [Candidatus Eisenbacteria bacterium]|uniref:DUF1579 domain-containing protein n=1 Tax=Eiseniibacteriota bacterium TaxID=2212470 RepID=A0A956SGS1_UNCEI|nr:hypothetical protein [Candidatus Eisenbacteria bacterium]MCB9462063.1 hypothetical protein [Candidatus Eisenbacteria bacterium]
MTRTICLLFLLLVCVVPGSVLAQHHGPNPAVSIEKMKAFEPMLGEWKGEGWMVLPNGERAEFLSTESAVLELGGTLVLVRGKHFSKDDPERVVHDALATIAWDQAEERYRFLTHLATGALGDFTIVPTDTGFSWTIDLPMMKMRYVADFTDGSWVETGERSMDGTTWTPFFEMRLTRQ